MKKKIVIKAEKKLQHKIIGISSHQKDYRLSWAINNISNLKLTKTNDYTVTNKKDNSRKYFSIFLYINKADTCFRLISNKSESGILSHRYKNIDYFLLVSNTDDFLEVDDILNNINKLDVIIGCFVVEPDRCLKKLTNSFLF